MEEFRPFPRKGAGGRSYALSVPIHGNPSPDAPGVAPTASVFNTTPKHLHRTDIVGRRRQIDDERLGEKVRAFRVRATLFVDEDICKGCCSIANTCGSREAVQDAADKPVDRCRLVFLIRFAVLVDQHLPGIHTCVIGLVIDEKKREVGDHGPPGLPVACVGSVVAYPAKQAFKNSLVLLDHKQPRALFRGDAEAAGDWSAEIAPLCAVRGIVRPYALVRIEFSHAYGYKGVAIDGTGLETKKRLVQAHLSLCAQVVVQFPRGR